MKFIIYCDGSARNNGMANAIGAWAYVILKEDESIIREAHGVRNGATNQQMELTAALEALNHLYRNNIAMPFDTVEIYTDSAYLHNCYMQKWYEKWQSNGWCSASKKPVANKELWEQLIPYFEKAEVWFMKTAGHAGVKWNEYVDGLAQTASLKAKEPIK